MIPSHCLGTHTQWNHPCHERVKESDIENFQDQIDRQRLAPSRFRVSWLKRHGENEMERKISEILQKCLCPQAARHGRALMGALGGIILRGGNIWDDSGDRDKEDVSSRVSDPSAYSNYAPYRVGEELPLIYGSLVSS